MHEMWMHEMWMHRTPKGEGRSMDVRHRTTWRPDAREVHAASATPNERIDADDQTDGLQQMILIEWQRDTACPTPAAAVRDGV
jgi:hypothetical protein